VQGTKLWMGKERQIGRFLVAHFHTLVRSRYQYSTHGGTYSI